MSPLAFASRASRIATAGLVGLAVGAVLSSAQEAGEPAGARETRGKAVTPSRPEPVTYARRHALVIGAGEYHDPTFPDLRHAVDDAREVARVLVDRFDFAPEHVRLLLDGAADRAGVEQALEDWAADADRVGPDDLLLVYFAGHGVTRDLGPRGARGYLVPVDGRSTDDGTPVWSSLVGMNRLEDVSEAIRAKHALFVLDCCFGGLAVSRSSPPLAAGLASRARQVLTAGDRDQAVLDGGGDGGHSVFTGALLDGLAGAADRDGDEVFTFGELFHHVGRAVEHRTDGRQTPVQATFKDHEGGSVALFRPGVEPRPTDVHERLAQLERTRDQQLAELRRLSDALLVRDLAGEADLLWPESPEMIGPYGAWLERARALIGRRPLHEATIRRVREQAYLEQVVRGVAEEREGGTPDWTLADRELRWRHETFSALVEGIAVIETLAADVEARRVRSETVAERTMTGPEVAARWAAARRAIAAHPAYGRLDLPPQLGLVPLGPDPESSLWEFGHPRTGDLPSRDPVSGALAITPGTGLVFVLVPGGTVRIGAQRAAPDLPHFDPQAEEDEAPVFEVPLRPFFLSKYEMTQAAWRRFTGRNPSVFAPGHGPTATSAVDPTHPVESVTWEEARETLRRLGLVLPTEAEWEAACRAGTTTPWSTGPDRDSLRGAANLADRAARRGGALWADIEDWPELDDGFASHAPVGSYRPNAYGLHDMHGNVWEWCRDAYAPYGTAPADGERQAEARVSRGGSFFLRAAFARSANRSSDPPGFRSDDLGVRPARPIDRE